jgi:hypothetical protein
MNALILSTGLATVLAHLSLGGGLFEYRVLDPAWPTNPALIQPRSGGVDRKQFWIPMHLAFELALVVALFVAWGEPSIRAWLLVAFVSHAAMRGWSAIDFIPKALAFERADETISVSDARSWTRRSLARLPLSVLTSLATLAAFGTACGFRGP